MFTNLYFQMCIGSSLLDSSTKVKVSEVPQIQHLPSKTCLLYSLPRLLTLLLQSAIQDRKPVFQLTNLTDIT